MASLATIAAVASIVSTGVGVFSTLKANKLETQGATTAAQGAMVAAQANANAADFEARQLEANSVQERAVAQAKALEERRNMRLALSSLTARGAASGFSATDPSNLKLAADIASQGQYRAEAERFGGDYRASGLKTQGKSLRMSAAAGIIGAKYTGSAYQTAAQASNIARYANLASNIASSSLFTSSAGTGAGLRYG